MIISKLSTARRRLAVSATVLPLMVGGLAVATARSADAADGCTHPSWSDLDSRVGHVNTTSVPLRTGPDGSCNQIAVLGPAADLDLDCYIVKPSGKTWSHLRVMGVSPVIQGWVADVNLVNTGSLERC